MKSISPQKIVLVLAIVTAPLVLNGCIAALIGAGAYAANSGPDDKKHYQEVCVERKKAGLRPISFDEYRHPQLLDYNDQRIKAGLAPLTWSAYENRPRSS